jgi:DNA-binding response OmpR family regulator
MSGTVKRVLVIDSNASDYQMAQGILGYAGYTLSSCADLTGIAQAITVYAPDVILIDMAFPSRSFFSLMREIKTLTASLNIPVIAVHKERSDANKQIALTLGASDFIGKPYIFNELLESVQRAVK